MFSLFLQSGIKKLQAYFLLFLFALMAPIGVFSANLFSDLNQYSNEIMAIVTGMFLHISTTIIFESNEGHRFSLEKIITIITGIIIDIFSV